MSTKFKTTSLMGAVIIAVIFMMTGVVQHVVAVEESPAAAPKPPAMPVEIVVIKEQPIRLWTDFSGRLTAVDYVEVRPQASGLITKVNFEDGQFVKKGDTLYVIDPRPLKAIVEQENADLIVAKNNLELADKEYNRAEDLVKKKMISQQVYDERMINKMVANAAVKKAEAELTEARINLSYAYIKSPVSGRVSRAELTEGNLVSAGPNAPLLTSIVSSKNIYADFEVDEQTYTQYISNTLSKDKSGQDNPVELRLQNSDQVYRGKIHAFDNRIDSASGTIRARAIFANPQSKLLPGMYANLRLGSVSEEKIIMISERAIGTDQNRKFVYVVNDENKTTYREIKLGDSIGGDRVVQSGLSVGDKVIVRGLMRVQPNMLVSPQAVVKAETKTKKS